MKWNEEKGRDERIEQAAAWQALEDRGRLPAEVNAEFFDWLRDNPQNIEEYLENARMLQLLGKELKTRPSESPTDREGGSQNFVRKVVSIANAGKRQPTAPPKSMWNRLTKFLRVAAIMLLTAGMVWAALYAWRRPPTIQVAHGDQRTFRLDDGSLVHLNSQSKIRIEFSKTERRVDLVEGQALFKVTKDPSRPFVVVAGDARVVAVGTQFDVYRRQDKATWVTVIEGKVDVIEAPPAIANSATPPKPLRVVAGQQVRVDAQARKSAAAAADVDVATAWVRREVVFRDESLGNVVREFNRYLDRPLVIDDAELRTLQINGTFSAYDPEMLFRFLRQFSDIAIVDDGHATHIRIQSTRASSGTAAAER